MTRMIILGRGTAVKRDETLYFQALDGAYVSELAERFGPINLLCPVVDHQDPQYGLYSGYSYELDPEKVKVKAIPRVGLRQWRTIWREIGDADIVFGFMPTFQSVAGIMISFLRGIPRIVYLGSEWKKAVITTRIDGGLRVQIRARAYDILEKLCMSLGDLRMVTGPELFNKYCDEKRTFMTVSFRQISEKQLLKREINISDACVRILCVASLIPRKGINYLLTACALLRDQSIHCQLTLVGTGEEHYVSQLQSQIKSLDLSASVKLTGYVGETSSLLEIYRESDIFVLPTLHEGYPRVLDEAMSQSLPIVTTLVGGIPSTLTHGEEALLVAPEDPEALSSAIKLIVHDATIRNHLSMMGFLRASDVFVDNVNAASQIHDLVKASKLVDV